jgi:regulator of Ty1 transposition protein 103
VPPELTPVLTSLQTVTKSAPVAKNAVKAANTDYEKVQDPATATSPPALQAARLTGVLKNLASAEGAVTECIKARMELVTALEKILAANREELRAEQEDLRTINSRLADAERKKKDVELIIIGGLPSSEPQSAGDGSSGSPIAEPDRPQVEALTPPHVQDHDDLYENSPEPRNGEAQTVTFSSAPGIEMLSNLASHYQAVPVNGSSKKRKIDTSSDFPDLGGDDGIDADVAEMLKDKS